MKSAYEVRLHQVVGDILNHSGSLNQTLDRRTKLGMPLYFSCVNNPIGTMDYFITVLINLEHSPKYSLILAACVCFCFQYIPKRARERVMRALEKILSEHAVPHDPAQIGSFGSFLENGGARLMPCVEVVLRRIVTHDNEKIRTSVKLVSPILATDPLNLAKVLYEAQNRRPLDNSDLFLLGHLHGSMELPRPADPELVRKLVSACRERLTKRKLFYDIECALMCYSLLISWKVVEPDRSVLNIENPSLRKLAIGGFADYVRVNPGKTLPAFQETKDPMILTAYLKVISVFLRTESCDVSKLKIKHWLLDAILNEFYTEVPPNEIILQSQSPFDMSIEDLEILATIPEWLPMWLYLHLMRVRTRNSTLVKSCMKILCQAPKMVMNVLFDEFIMFLDSVLEMPDIIGYVSEMLHTLVPFLEGKVHSLTLHLCQKMDYFSVESVDTHLQILNTVLLFDREKHPFMLIMDCLMENFDNFSLSPSFLQHIFCFFEHVAEWNTSYNNELLLMAMAVITSPFLSEAPTYLTHSPRYLMMFKQCQLFFSLVASDVVLDPVLKMSDCFPPCPAALRLIAKLTVHDSQYDAFLSDALVHALTICPTEAVLAARILPKGKRDTFVQAVAQFLKICDRTSFTIAASQLMEVDMENLIMYDESDDLRLILQFRSEFVPLVLQCRDKVGILLEKTMPCFEPELFSGVRNDQIDFYMHRVFRFFNVERAYVSREDGWTSTEVSAASAFVRLRRQKFVEDLLRIPVTESDMKTTRDLFCAFRVRFPLEKETDYHKELVQAVKRYRKRDQCLQMLKMLWHLPDANRILPFCEPKLWILRFIPPNWLKSMKRPEDEKALAYFVRLNLASPEVDDDESILCLEKARNDRAFAMTLDSPLMLQYYFVNPCLLSDSCESVPSLMIRRVRNMVAFFSSSDSPVDPDKIASQNEILCNIIQSYDIHNPVLVREMCNELTYLLSLQTTRSSKLKKSLLVHTFISRILSKTPIELAVIYDSLETIATALEFAKSDDAGRLKTFWSKYRSRALDTSKLLHLECFRALK